VCVCANVYLSVCACACCVCACMLCACVREHTPSFRPSGSSIAKHHCMYASVFACVFAYLILLEVLVLKFTDLGVLRRFVKSIQLVEILKSQLCRHLTEFMEPRSDSALRKSNRCSRQIKNVYVYPYTNTRT